MEKSGPHMGTAVSRGKVVPLIGSDVRGSLGLMHLPRLWLKALLLATEHLAEDWGCGPGGLDKRTMDTIGVDAGEFVAWLLREFPTYAECETWIREHALALDAASIAQANDYLATSTLPRGLGAKFRAYLGIDDTRVDGIRLNNLDDWMAVHQYVLRHDADGGSIVPAISPRTCGPLGIAQLPRFWLIAFLNASGVLPPDYRFADDPNGRELLRALGVGPAAAIAFIGAKRPTYLQFEAWLRERAAFDAERDANVDPDTATMIEAHDWELLHRNLAALRAMVERARTSGIYSFALTSRLAGHPPT